VTKRFMVSTEVMTAEEEKKIKEIFSGAGWWHWLPNVWLVRDGNEKLTASKIAEEFGKINSSAQCLVLEVDKKTWSARSKPDPNGRKLSDWIKETWDKD
jgi:hypothetical protein